MSTALTVVLAAAAALAVASEADPQPLRLHPANPHYFLFRGKPTILITSGEHYGAVLNLDFDYGKYLDALRRSGMNHTRTFVGAYCEPDGAFNITGNSLAPAPGRFSVPGPAAGSPATSTVAASSTCRAGTRGISRG
jgi:hypothetical protein